MKKVESEANKFYDGEDGCSQGKTHPATNFGLKGEIICKFSPFQCSGKYLHRKSAKVIW